MPKIIDLTIAREDYLELCAARGLDPIESRLACNLQATGRDGVPIERRDVIILTSNYWPRGQSRYTVLEDDLTYTYWAINGLPWGDLHASTGPAYSFTSAQVTR